MDTSKVIRGVVNSGRYTVTAPIVKEDYGLKLKIDGVELPPTYQVDFSNDEHHGTSVTMIGNADGVKIPRQFIDTGKDVFAFLYWVGEDYGKTVYKFRIPNKVRPDRTDETPTPEEQSLIDQAIGALNTAVAKTAQDVISADQSARSASNDADRAERARDTAQGYASNAQLSATQANNSASSAYQSASASAQSASQSAQIKADVEDLVDDAQTSANASEQYAGASATSATQAQGYAQSASASAQSASGYASNAQTYANTASSKAEEASGYAQTASDKATEASQSASQALGYKNDAESAKTASQTAQGLAESARDSAISAKTDAESARDDAETARDEAQQAVASIADALAEKAPVITDTASGSIASFSDGADDLPLKSLVIDINPVQDLHGYDSPWIGGGGKNKIDQDTVYEAYKQSDGSFLMTGGNSIGVRFYIPQELVGKELTFSAYLKIPSGSTLTNARVAVKVGETASSGTFANTSEYTRSVITFTPVSTDDNVYITFGSNGGQLLQAKDIQLEIGSTATEYTPYENLCPISGWTGCEVDVSGKNLFDEANATIYKRYFRNTSGGYVWTSFPDSSSYVFKCLPNTIYTLKPNNPDVSIFRVATINVSIEESENVTLNQVSVTTNPRTITTNSDATYIVIQESNTIASERATQLQIELGDSATEYESFKGVFTPISWQSEAGTVYGGKLDVLSGVLTVDRAMVDLGTLGYSKSNLIQNGFVATSGMPNDFPLAPSTIAVPNWICSNYGNIVSNVAIESASVDYAIAWRVSARNKGIIVKDSNYAGFYTNNDMASFKAAMPGIQLVYELAEPIEIQLDAHTINSLYGQNNIFADTGDTEVIYRADTKLYIQKKIAEAISALS